MVVRPYQLMCIVCRLGAKTNDKYYFPERLNAIERLIRKNPDSPLALRCNVDTVFRYQNPGRKYDTPEGRLFNDKRDLAILQRLGMAPGDTRPARDIFKRLIDAINNSKGICGAYEGVRSVTWRGCRLAADGNYARGCTIGRTAVIPARCADEKARAKKNSVREIYRAKILKIRPHHLLCMTCFHGGKTNLAPIQEDNLFEVIDVMQKNPAIRVKLVAGPCIICPPCSAYNPKQNLCFTSGMRDQQKDLDTLQFIGLKYGAVLPARKLLRLIYARIPSTKMVCAYRDGIRRAPEWHICNDPEGSQNYTKGRAAGLGVIKPK